MRLYSAAEAMTPAIERTKAILFRPFRAGRTWKLAATAYLCRMGTLFIPFPLAYLFLLPVARSKGPVAVAALVAGTLLITGFYYYLFSVGSRLQFAFFDIVVNKEEFVAPAWRKYKPQSRRWTAWKAVAGTFVSLAFAIPASAYVKHVWPLLQTMRAIEPGHPPPHGFTMALFTAYGTTFLFFGLSFLISSLLADFIVPFLALEPIGASEALTRTAVLVRREPGQFALYTLLKIGLGLAIYGGVIVAWEIAFVLCSIVFAAILGLVGYLLHLAGIPLAPLTVIGTIVGVAWYLFTIIYALLLTTGVVMTFLDAHGLYFLGARYPLLGDLMDGSEPLLVPYMNLSSYTGPPPPPLP